MESTLKFIAAPIPINGYPAPIAASRGWDLGTTLSLPTSRSLTTVVVGKSSTEARTDDVLMVIPSDVRDNRGLTSHTPHSSLACLLPTTRHPCFNGTSL